MKEYSTRINKTERKDIVMLERSEASKQLELVIPNEHEGSQETRKKRFFVALRMTKQSFVIGEFCSNRSNVALPPLRQ